MKAAAKRRRAEPRDAISDAHRRGPRAAEDAGQPRLRIRNAGPCSSPSRGSPGAQALRSSRLDHVDRAQRQHGAVLKVYAARWAKVLGACGRRARDVEFARLTAIDPAWREQVDGDLPDVVDAARARVGPHGRPSPGERVTDAREAHRFRARPGPVPGRVCPRSRTTRQRRRPRGRARCTRTSSGSWRARLATRLAAVRRRARELCASIDTSCGVPARPRTSYAYNVRTRAARDAPTRPGARTKTGPTRSLARWTACTATTRRVVPWSPTGKHSLQRRSEAARAQVEFTPRAPRVSRAPERRVRDRGHYRRRSPSFGTAGTLTKTTRACRPAGRRAWDRETARSERVEHERTTGLPGARRVRGPWSVLPGADSLPRGARRCRRRRDARRGDARGNCAAAFFSRRTWRRPRKSWCAVVGLLPRRSRTHPASRTGRGCAATARKCCAGARPQSRKAA